MPKTVVPGGALVVLPPGSKPGPCAKSCRHAACAEARRFAAMACIVCGRPNGYGVPVYCFDERHGHADCLHAEHEEKLGAFVDGLADLVADLYLAGHLPEPGKLAESGQVLRRRREARSRYTIPEFDFDVVIPVGKR